MNRYRVPGGALDDFDIMAELKKAYRRRGIKISRRRTKKKRLCPEGCGRECGFRRQRCDECAIERMIAHDRRSRKEWRDRNPERVRFIQDRTNARRRQQRREQQENLS